MSLALIIKELKSIEFELDYWKTEAMMAYDVINQLTNGPGDVTLIHPYDLAEMLNELTVEKVDVNTFVEAPNIEVAFINDRGTDQEILTINGKKYRQTTLLHPSKQHSTI